tara:strand:- start:46 stop:834 length:789 start_codon:yes stop_codon:yes gene_type:complete
MKRKSGIYGIKINGKLEVGYSKDFKARWSKHRTFLKYNKHWNEHLQNAYNKYGEYEFVVLEETTEWLAEKEVMWIEKCGYYNKTEGGDGGDVYSMRTIEKKEEHKERCRQKWTGKNNHRFVDVEDKVCFDLWIEHKSSNKAAAALSEMLNKKITNSLIMNRGKKYAEENGVDLKAVIDEHHQFYTSSFLGRKHTASSREKMSGENNYMWRHDVKTEDLLADREAGMSYKKIAEKYGVSKYMPKYRLQKYKKILDKPSPIDYI